MNFSLSGALEKRIRELSAASGKAPEALVDEAVERLLEDEADRAEIGARMSRFEKTGQAFEHEIVLDKLRERTGSSREWRD